MIFGNFSDTKAWVCIAISPKLSILWQKEEHFACHFDFNKLSNGEISASVGPALTDRWFLASCPYMGIAQPPTSAQPSAVKTLVWRVKMISRSKSDLSLKPLILQLEQWHLEMPGHLTLDSFAFNFFWQSSHLFRRKRGEDELIWSRDTLCTLIRSTPPPKKSRINATLAVRGLISGTTNIRIIPLATWRLSQPFKYSVVPEVTIDRMGTLLPL